MIREADRHYVLFDGDCGICSYSAQWVMRRDHKARFAVEPYQLSSEEALSAAGLSYEKCARKAWVVSRSGRLYGGAFAINYVLLSFFPWSLLVLLIYACPPFLLIEVIVYYFVAKNRHVLSRWLGLRSCGIRDAQAGEG
jgi:predicted DCC family thiol-disulfide oxidoreductase YuxK